MAAVDRPQKPPGDADLRALRDALGALELDPLQRSALDGHFLATLLFWDRQAVKTRYLHVGLRLLALLAGLGVPAVAAFDLSPTTTKRWVAVLGLLAAAGIGVDGFLNLGGRWLHYRLAAERLRGELWRFVLLGAGYGPGPHRVAFPLLADTVDRLIESEAGEYVRGPARPQQQGSQSGESSETTTSSASTQTL